MGFTVFLARLYLPLDGNKISSVLETKVGGQGRDGASGAEREAQRDTAAKQKGGQNLERGPG